MPGREDKKRSDGSLVGGKDGARTSKKINSQQRQEVGDGSQRLGARRIWRWLTDEGDE